MTLYSEVVDSLESAREFLDLNKIEQKEIKCIVVVWDWEDDGE